MVDHSGLGQLRAAAYPSSRLIITIDCERNGRKPPNKVKEYCMIFESLTDDNSSIPFSRGFEIGKKFFPVRDKLREIRDALGTIYTPYAGFYVVSI